MARLFSDLKVLLLGLLFFLAFQLSAEEVLWPVYGSYALTSVRDLSVALKNDRRENLWKKIAGLEKHGLKNNSIDKVLQTEEKISAIWIKTLLGLKSKDVYRIKEAMTEYRELRQTYPEYMPQRRCFATLSKIHAALRSSLEPVERAQADNWLINCANRREADTDEKTAEYFSAAYRVFAGVACGRMDLSTQGKMGLKKFLLSLNKDAMPTAMEIGVSHFLLENVCQAAEVFAGSGDDLFLMTGDFSKGRDMIIKAWAMKLAELMTPLDILPGRGWEKDALFSPKAAFILACRYSVAIMDLEKAANADPCAAAFYYTRAYRAAPINDLPLLSSPVGTGWLVARSRVRKGLEARYARLITVSGGRFGDLLSIAFNGGEKPLMGRTSQQDGSSKIGRDYFTHTIASSTVAIDHKKQKAAGRQGIRGTSMNPYRDRHTYQNKRHR